VSMSVSACVSVSVSVTQMSAIDLR